MSSFLSIGWKIKGWNGRYFNWGWNDILHNVVWKGMGWNPGGWKGYGVKLRVLHVIY